MIQRSKLGVADHAISAALQQLLDGLGATEITLINRGGWGNGDVYSARVTSGPVIIKSYLNQSRMERAIGRILVRRETTAYRKLAGLPGVPGLVKSADPHTLILEQIEAERISNQMLAERGAAVIESMDRLLTSMHDRGVYHMDLRNQGNILVDAESQVWLIDFASRVILKPRGLLDRTFGRACLFFDEYGASKWRGRAG